LASSRAALIIQDLRDLPEAEFHLLDGGHWLLEISWKQSS
jgi:hypothetical protein